MILASSPSTTYVRHNAPPLVVLAEYCCLSRGPIFSDFLNTAPNPINEFFVPLAPTRLLENSTLNPPRPHYPAAGPNHASCSSLQSLNS